MNLFFNVSEECKHLSEFISLLINNPAKLEAIASNSYSHVLGFDKIVLKKNPSTGDKLALHIWWPGAVYLDDDIHHHRWDFSSLLLAGKMYIKKYESDAEGELFHQYKHVSPQEAEYYQLTECGMDRICVKEELNLSAGDQYFHKYSDLHHVERKEDFVVTLFAQSPPRVNYSYIFTKTPIEKKLMKVDATRMSKNYLQDCLVKLYATLY